MFTLASALHPVLRPALHPALHPVLRPALHSALHPVLRPALTMGVIYNALIHSDLQIMHTEFQVGNFHKELTYR